MNGAATVTATEDHQHQHQQPQNETTSDHPRSPASPLSVRHGKSNKIAINVEKKFRKCFKISCIVPSLVISEESSGLLRCA